MKIGLPVFGYQNFPTMAQYIKERGFFTANLGDNMQSIAVRMLLKKLGLEDDEIVSIDRDEMRDYSGPPAALIMNGVFYDWCFPISGKITPIFIGFHATEATIAKHKHFFAQHQPIGCRDCTTAEHFAKHGITAHVTGCLTLTIPRRQSSPSSGKVLVVYGGLSGTGVGDFPASALHRMPAPYFDDLEFVYQRIPLTEHPLNQSRRLEVETYALSLLRYYADHAKLVITTLHHAAAPCMALGIPVIICRHAMDPRFSFLSEIVPIHTAGNFDAIDWAPTAANIEPVRQQLEALVAQSVRAVHSRT